jgi:two-component system, cell cycle response regulator DivK
VAAIVEKPHGHTTRGVVYQESDMGMLKDWLVTVIIMNSRLQPSLVTYPDGPKKIGGAAVGYSHRRPKHRQQGGSGINEGIGMACILLVEDNEMNRDMLSRRLARRGFQVVMAVNGKECLEMTDMASPDLILMDLSLPEMDGWEVLRRLKQDAKKKKVPVIALTAHALVTDRDRALKAGFDDYDIKPVELPRLLKKMNTLLNERMSA